MKRSKAKLPVQVGIVNNYAESKKRYNGQIKYPSIPTVLKLLQEIKDKQGVLFKFGVVDDARIWSALYSSYGKPQVHSEYLSAHKKNLAALRFVEEKTVLVTWSGAPIDKHTLGRNHEG